MQLNAEYLEAQVSWIAVSNADLYSSVVCVLWRQKAPEAFRQWGVWNPCVDLCGCGAETVSILGKECHSQLNICLWNTWDSAHQ